MKTSADVVYDRSQETVLCADECEVIATRGEFALLFGQRELNLEPYDNPIVRVKRRILISPFAAKRLCRQLQGIVKAEPLSSPAEDKKIIVTAEELFAKEEKAQLETPVTPVEPPGEKLLRLIKELGVLHGYERTFKVMEGEVMTNRYLTTLLTQSLEPDPIGKLMNICKQMNMPPFFHRPIIHHYPGANVVHFGFEESRSGCICKFYLEYASRYKREVRAKGKCGPLLIDNAFKWDCMKPEQHATATYTSYPLLTIQEIISRISAIYDNNSLAMPVRIASEYMTVAAPHVEERKIMYLEVEEADNPRRSFDINVYHAGLPVKAFEPLLARIWEYFHISEAEARRVYEPIANLTMGHLSGGIARNGQEFLTVYYGVEELGGKS